MAREMHVDDSESFRVVLEYRFRTPNPAWLRYTDQPGVPEFLGELSDIRKSVVGPYRSVGAARGQRSRQYGDVIGHAPWKRGHLVFVRQYVERAETTWTEVPE